MEHFQITINYNSGKLVGQHVTFFKKKLDSALVVAKYYLSLGHSVNINSVSCVADDFINVVLDVINQDL